MPVDRPRRIITTLALQAGFVYSWGDICLHSPSTCQFISDSCKRRQCLVTRSSKDRSAGSRDILLEVAAKKKTIIPSRVGNSKSCQELLLQVQWGRFHTSRSFQNWMLLAKPPLLRCIMPVVTLRTRRKCADLRGRASQRGSKSACGGCHNVTQTLRSKCASQTLDLPGVLTPGGSLYGSHLEIQCAPQLCLQTLSKYLSKDSCSQDWRRKMPVKSTTCAKTRPSNMCIPRTTRVRNPGKMPPSANQVR